MTPVARASMEVATAKSNRVFKEKSSALWWSSSSWKDSYIIFPPINTSKPKAIQGENFEKKSAKIVPAKYPISGMPP